MSDTPAMTDHMTDQEIYNFILGNARYIGKRNKIDPYELIGDGYLGYASAVRNFDASMGFKFRTYAEFRVQGAMRDAIRDSKPLKRNLTGIATPLIFSYDEVMDSSEDDSTYRHGLYGELTSKSCTHSLPRDIKQEQLLRFYISSLKEKHRNILIAYYWHDRTMQDIAGDYGFTESRISQIITKTRLKIKQMFDKDIQIPKEEVMGRRAPSEEYLRKVADTIRDSYTCFDAAARLNISTSTINRWRDLYPEIKDALHNMKDPEVFTESNATPARPSITRDTNLPDFAFKGTVTFFGQPVHIDITVTRQSVQPSQPIQPVEA